MKKFLFKIISVELVFLVAVVLFQMMPTAYAIRSYTVHNVPDMTLRTAISSTATSNIQINAPQRNGAAQSYPTTTGGILEFKSGSKSEYIYYSSATVNSTTKIITLAGVVRGYCWDRSLFQSCETGKSWSPGTVVRLVVDMRLINNALKVDLQNTLTGSGRIKGTATGQAIFSANPVTTTQRNAFTTVSNGDVIYNTTTATMQARQGGSWVNFGSGGNVNTGFETGGKVELATPAEVFNQTGTGSISPLVVSAKDIVHSSGATSGAIGSSFVVATSGATIHPSLLCKGARTTTSVCAGSGEWVQPSLTVGFKHEATVTTASANVGANSTATGMLIPVWTGSGVDPLTLVAGSVIHVKAGGAFNLGAGAGYLQMRVGNVLAAVWYFDVAPTSTASAWFLNSEIDLRSVGASASAIASGRATFAINTSTAEEISTAYKFGSATGFPAPTAVTVDTTVPLHITFHVRFDTSNGSNMVNIQNGSIFVTNP